MDIKKQIEDLARDMYEDVESCLINMDDPYNIKVDVSIKPSIHKIVVVGTIQL